MGGILPDLAARKYFIDLRGDPYNEAHYQDLLVTLLGNREKAPPVREQPEALIAGEKKSGLRFTKAPATMIASSPVKIIGIIADQVSAPRGDGTLGSALYRVPFRLTRQLSQFWAEAFVRSWNMHLSLLQCTGLALHTLEEIPSSLMEPHLRR